MNDENEFPDDMDAECVRLCRAINKIPGLKTFLSCSGHGRDSFYIYFLADNFEGLRKIVHAIYVLNLDREIKRWHVLVGCNDVGDLYYQLKILRLNAFANADQLAFMLESEV